MVRSQPLRWKCLMQVAASSNVKVSPLLLDRSCRSSNAAMDLLVEVPTTIRPLIILMASTQGFGVRVTSV